MTRTAINPWSWSQPYGFNQAESIEAPQRTLYCSGQAAMDHLGKPQHAGDMHGQITLAFENVETILRAADMTIANVVKFVIYTTDVDSLIQHFGIISSRFAAVGVAPAQTMLGVSRLFLPQLLVEFEATAVA